MTKQKMTQSCRCMQKTHCIAMFSIEKHKKNIHIRGKKNYYPFSKISLNENILQSHPLLLFALMFCKINVIQEMSVHCAQCTQCQCVADDFNVFFIFIPVYDHDHHMGPFVISMISFDKHFNLHIPFFVNEKTLRIDDFMCFI